MDKARVQLSYTTVQATGLPAFLTITPAATTETSRFNQGRRRQYRLT